MKGNLIGRIFGIAAGALCLYMGITSYKDKDDMALTKWGPDISIGVGIALMLYSTFSNEFDRVLS
jgi:hypothetical protein